MYLGSQVSIIKKPHITAKSFSAIAHKGKHEKIFNQGVLPNCISCVVLAPLSYLDSLDLHRLDLVHLILAYPLGLKC